MLIQFIQKASDFVVRHKKVFSLLLLPITGVSILFGLLLIAPIFMVGRTLGLKMAYAPTDASQTVGSPKMPSQNAQAMQSGAVEPRELADVGFGSSAGDRFDAIAALQHLEKRLPSEVGGGFLKISIYPDRMDRMIRHATDRNDIRFRQTTVVNQRRQLTPFTRAIATAKGISYDVTGALDLTLTELRGGHVATVPAKSQAVSAAPISKSTDSLPKHQPNKAVSSARGRVKSAAMVEVKTEGKRPYRTFQVVISPVDGSEDVSFSGTDLNEKFEKKVFAKGDVISIRKSRVNYSETSGDGSTHERSKNVFEIEKLQFA